MPQQGYTIQLQNNPQNLHITDSRLHKTPPVSPLLLLFRCSQLRNSKNTSFPVAPGPQHLGDTSTKNTANQNTQNRSEILEIQQLSWPKPPLVASPLVHTKSELKILQEPGKTQPKNTWKQLVFTQGRFQQPPTGSFYRPPSFSGSWHLGNLKKTARFYLSCSRKPPAWPQSWSPYFSWSLASGIFKNHLFLAMEMQFLALSCFPRPPLSKFSNSCSQSALQASVASSTAGLLCIHSFTALQAAPSSSLSSGVL